MSASMLITEELWDFTKLNRIASEHNEPSALLEELEDRDDSEWQALGFASRKEYIWAFLRGEI